MNMDLIHEGNSIRTAGLASSERKELRVSVESPNLVPHAEAFLLYVTSYLDSGGVLKPGQTFPYGYWLTQFVENDDVLEAWEYNPDATRFVKGATLTLTYWRDQHETCERFQASFAPPRPDRLVVVSAGVLEGDNDVQGVRYPSPEHMAGWWLTTGRYDGNAESLKTVHAYHLTQARPDLAHLLALPYGYRFDLTNIDDVWFDESVASERAE